MDPSDKIRALQGKIVLKNFQAALATQANAQLAVCGGFSTCVVRYPAYEYREEIRNGLATTCNTCATTVCEQSPYGGKST
jgi:hypothetical protein